MFKKSGSGSEKRKSRSLQYFPREDLVLAGAAATASNIEKRKKNA